MQQLKNDAETSGRAVATSFINAFEERCKRPDAAQINVLETEARAHFAALPAPWGEGESNELTEIWRPAMEYCLQDRIKIHRRLARMASLPLHS
jgi:hypothetical protein